MIQEPKLATAVSRFLEFMLSLLRWFSPLLGLRNGMIKMVAVETRYLVPFSSE